MRALRGIFGGRQNARRGRRRRSVGLVGRAVDGFSTFREGAFRMWPFALASAVFVASAGAYGLWQGGYVARLADGVAAFGHRTETALGLTVQEITLSGRKRVSSTAVMAALGTSQGASILMFDVGEARSRLEAIDWVERASVRRLLPDRLHVDIVEREPFALWQLDGEVVVIDRRGEPFLRDGAEHFAHLPLVVGEGAGPHAEAIISLLDSTPVVLSRVRALVRVADRRWNLRLDNGVDVLLPEEGVAEALADLSNLDAEHRILARDIQAIDLRLPDRVTVRLTPEGAARRDAVEKGGDANAFGVRSGGEKET